MTYTTFADLHDAVKTEVQNVEALVEIANVVKGIRQDVADVHDGFAKAFAPVRDAWHGAASDAVQQRVTLRLSQMQNLLDVLTPETVAYVQTLAGMLADASTAMDAIYAHREISILGLITLRSGLSDAAMLEEAYELLFPLGQHYNGVAGVFEQLQKVFL